MAFQLMSSAHPGILIAADYSRDLVFRWPYDPSSGWWKLEKHHWFNGMTLPQVEAAIDSGEAFRLHGDPGGPLPLPPGIQRCGVCGDPVRSPRCRCAPWLHREEEARLARHGWRRGPFWSTSVLGALIRGTQDKVSEAPEGGPQTVDEIRMIDPLTGRSSRLQDLVEVRPGVWDFPPPVDLLGD